ncbi:MarR family winged helix-turn-helix transcriptional regulator [Streptomyces sp. NBC_01198]|uniref:MarR family winged helix-turn-helix transcriptional regulator n=1 Tax=Streptomyces sp. NBC_01198 TaxID=2903769 RepID=UPI002E15F6E9|nr:MarR family winged helix-turn-helix transcriptional regulator [Streptomyces sp. NBC_01198]
MDQPTTPPTLTALTTYLLSRTGKTARGRLAAELAEQGLRLWHMAVLAALADFGPHTQRDLADRLAIDPSDMVKVLDDLTAAGHVTRTRDPADRRRVRVTLTPAGRSALAALVTGAESVQAALLAPLTPAERATLHGLLGRLFAGRGGTPDDQ